MIWRVKQDLIKILILIRIFQDSCKILQDLNKISTWASTADGGSNLQVVGRRSQVAGHCFTNTESILNIHKS